MAWETEPELGSAELGEEELGGGFPEVENLESGEEELDEDL